MFIVLLKFADNKAAASDHLQAHNNWLKSGFDDGVFLLAGSLKPGLGGVILADKLSGQALQKRVQQDPFVRENVVHAEILDIAPGKADQRLAFLLEA